MFFFRHYISVRSVTFFISSTKWYLNGQVKWLSISNTLSDTEICNLPLKDDGKHPRHFLCETPDSPPGLQQCHVFENYNDNNDLVAFHSFFSEPQWQCPVQHDNLSIFSILFHLNLGLVFIIVFFLLLYAPDGCKVGFSTGWSRGWNKLFSCLVKDKSNTVY